MYVVYAQPFNDLYLVYVYGDFDAGPMRYPVVENGSLSRVFNDADEIDCDADSRLRGAYDLRVRHAVILVQRPMLASEPRAMCSVYSVPRRL